MTHKSARRVDREKLIAKLPGDDQAVYEVLRNYVQLLKVLPTLTEAQLVKALKLEKANMRRGTFIERITMRLNKVRGQNAHAQSRVL